MSAACDSVGPPVVAGEDVGEIGLAHYLDELRNEVLLAPESAELRGRLAMAYDANGFIDAAIATYTQAAALDGDDFRWPYLKALALGAEANVELALTEIDRSLELEPEHTGAWLSKGGWLLEADDYPGAKDAYARAKATASDQRSQAASDVGLARALLREGNAAAAVEILETAVAVFEHPYVKQTLATAYRHAGTPERVGDLGLDAEPADPLTWPDAVVAEKSKYVRGFSGQMLVAQKMLRDRSPQDALEILRQLRATEPDNRDLLNNLSIAYKQLGRREEAFQTLLEGLEAHPDFQLFHFNLAVIYEERGDYERALQHFDRAIAIDPALQGAHERKFGLLVRQNRLEQALADLAEATEHVTLSASTLFQAGLAAGALERWPIAVETLEAAVRINSQDPRAQLFLGRSYAESGRFDAARDTLARAEALSVDQRSLQAAQARLDELLAGRERSEDDSQ